MSSWERSRNIPWSLIRQDGGDPDAYKEQVFKAIQKQLMQEGENEEEAFADLAQGKQTRVPFDTMEMLKMAAFGGTIGSITGSVFGFMDSMRTAGESSLLQKASNSAKAKYIMQGTTRSAMVFGTFFGGFHVVRYGIRVAANPGEWTEIGISGVVSMGALFSKPALRPSVPYASMLIIMDGVQVLMKTWNK